MKKNSTVAMGRKQIFKQANSCFRLFVAGGVMLVASLALHAAGRAQRQTAGSQVNTIVSEWLAAVGGRERIARVKSIYRTATSDEDGLEGTREEWITARLNRKEKIDHVHDRSVTVLNGRQAWLRDWNGKRQKLAAYDLEVQEDTAILHSFAALEGSAECPAANLVPVGYGVELQHHQ